MNDFNTTTPSVLSGEDRTMAILAHLSGPVAVWLGGAAFIGPLIFYFLTRDRSPELKAHVLESLNFAISTTAIIWIGGVLSFILFFIPILGLIVLIPLGIAMAVAGIGYLVYGVIGAIDVTNNRLRRYPFTWRLVTS